MKVKAENEKLLSDLSAVKQKSSSDPAAKAQEKEFAFLKDQNARLEELQATISNDLVGKTSKNKDLATSLNAVELERNELQKKYDDTKRGYFKLREERDQLKKDLEKHVGVEGSEGNQIQTDKKQIETAAGDKNNPTVDVQ